MVSSRPLHNNLKSDNAVRKERTILLQDFKLFQTIIKQGGLAAAGRELGMSRATVSERLAALEAQFNARLLTRTTRAISLTEEGRILLEGAHRILSASEDVQNAIRHGVENLAGTVRLSMPSDIGRNRMGAVLDEFMAKHPAIILDVALTDAYVDLIADGFDFAIRMGQLPDSTMKSRVVAQNRRIVCATPRYLTRHGTPTHPEQLEQHNCIIMRFGRDLDNSWPFHIDGKDVRVLVRGNRIANDGGYVKTQLLAGHGIAYKSRWDVAHHLQAGSLVEILKDYSVESSPYQLVYPAGAVQPLRVRALMDHIAEWFARQGMA